MLGFFQEEKINYFNNMQATGSLSLRSGTKEGFNETGLSVKDSKLSTKKSYGLPQAYNIT